MKALVTGASGFIGSTLIEELGTLGFDVYALMRKSSSAANLEGLKFTRVEGDLSDYESLKNAVKNVDYVFHLAGVIAAKNREGFFQHNAGGTQRLADAVAEVRPNLTRFVYVSSLAAGGPADSLDPRTEGHADRPVSAYGESKLKGEKELLRYRHLYPISIVRPPMVYGPKDKATFLIIQTVARNLMPIFGGSGKEGKKFYSTIHVKDLCRGIVQAAVAPKERNASGEVFYLASDGVTSYEEILSQIAECLECEPLKIKLPKFLIHVAAGAATAAGTVMGRTFPLNWDKRNELLPDYWICSNEKAKKLLSFAPEYDLSHGMVDAIEWYKKHQWIK